MRKLLVLFLCCVCVFTSAKGESISVALPAHNGIVYKDSLGKNVKDTIRHKKHRAVAALLAFPLGVFGLHRMYLGTSGKVPLIYIVTGGGVLGVLPFIDFVLILLSKDMNATYTGNKHLFMWQKETKDTISTIKR